MKEMILNRGERVGLNDSIQPINFRFLAIAFALLFALAPATWGQEIEWIRQFGGTGPAEDLAEAVDANGNIYIAGKTDGTLAGQTSAGGTDAFVRKYDSIGNELWTRQFGTEFSDYAYGISVDATGAVYVAGYTDGTLPGQTSDGGRDAFVRKYDLSGNELWTRQFGTVSTDQARGISVDATGVYVSGYTYDALPGQTSSGGYDAFVRKYNLNGTEVWTRQFGTTSGDYAYGISLDATGEVPGVYVVGYTQGALPGQTSAGNYDAFVRKYELNGTELWTRQFGTTSYDYAYGISIDATGVYVVGSTYGSFLGQTSAGYYDAFVRKYDANGAELWTRQFGTASRDYAYGISVDATGVYVAGYTIGTLPDQTSAGNYDAFVRKYDIGGTEVWTRQFGTASSDYASGISVDATGMYVVGYTNGTLPGQTSAGEDDAFMRKYDFNGDELWTRQFGGVGPSMDVYTCVTANGNVYIAGKTDGTLPGQTSSGGSDVFLSRYDPDGNDVWTLQFGTSSDDYAQGISVDAEGVYVTGYTNGTLGQTSFGSYDVFVRKYDLNGNEVWTRQFGTTSSDQAYGISIDGTGVYLAGYTYGKIGQTSAGGYDVFVRKYDLNGNELWTHQFGSTRNDYAHGISVNDEGVYVTGYTYGTLPGQTSDGGTDAFVRKYDLNGNTLWTRQFGTTSYDYAYGISNDAEGVYVTGNTIGEFPGQSNAGSSDAFVRKYDLSGTELWTNQFGTASSDNAIGFSIDVTGVYVAGYTSGAFPGQTSAGGMDAFVRKYNNFSGTEQWTYQFGTSSYDQASGIAIDATGLYVSGYTNGTFSGQTSSGDYDAFVAKLMLNQPPVVVAIGPFNVDEGGSVLVTSSGSDPDEDPLTFEWDLDNDGNFETPGQNVTFSAAGLDGPGSQLIVVKVTDSGGLFATDQTTVEILNVAPTVGEISAPLDPVPVNTEINASADFTDPGVPDTHTAEWYWGDGSTSVGDIDEANGSGTVTGNHTYTAAGVYTDTLIVWDEDSDSDTSVFQYVVVYDPSAGYVTGAGWIDSPVGAYPSEPSLTGKAKFGFVSKYKKGQSTPDGNTKFSFKTADLKFQSTSYDWLVIAGPHAKYKGSGMINGDGDYGFMLTAVDGDVNGGGGIDKFRIKIWDKATDQVVYDNQLGDPDDGDATDAIEAGSIVIHQGIELPKSDNFAEDMEQPEAKPKQFALFQNYPNPFNPETMIRFQIPQANHVVVRIFNTLGAEIRKLVNGQYESGNYSVIWNGKDNSGQAVASGTYIYQIQAGQFVDVKRMVLIR